MVAPPAGSVVLVRFPFSDLSQTKLRPALVVARVGNQDLLLSQITSNPYGDELSQRLTDVDFQSGSLRTTSYARPGKLFTASQNLVVGVVGQLHFTAFHRVVHALIRLVDLEEENYGT